MRKLLLTLVSLVLLPAHAAELLPLSAFANANEFSHPDISPDGKHLVYLDRSSGRVVVALIDLATSERRAVVAGEANDFVASSCWFKNDTRLLCHYYGTDIAVGNAFTVSRLLAVDVDGKDQKVLVQNGRAGSSQFQDRIVDTLRNDPRNVLIELDDNEDVFTSVFKLDVYSGKLTKIQSDRFPILRWVTDRDGVVRFGYGYKDDQSVYITRDSETAPWRTLLKFKVFDAEHFSVYGFGVLPNKLIVSAPKDGLDAVWEMDLADQSDRQLLFANSQVDVEGPVIWPNDQHLVGFKYDTDKPQLELFDSRARSVQDAVDKLLPGAVNRVVSASRDDQRLVIVSDRDVQSSSYYLLDLRAGRLQKLAQNAPLLTAERLATMKPVVVKAKDGAAIAGYLTVPVGRDAKNLPAIVLPHGGPYARDNWGFDELVQMLASRGYAVLQVNYRGSTGYGDAWFRAGFQHWGTTMHEDITAGTHWLVEQGIADPKRVCLVGWSYGGYAALIGAVKEAALYQCVVSIAGVSDMKDLAWERRGFYGGRTLTQLGTGMADRDDNSPLKRAAEIKLPVMLVHGTWDINVNVDHSKSMARALARAGNAPKLVLIEHGDHSLSKPEMRLMLFQNLEQFLAAHLPAK